MEMFDELRRVLQAIRNEGADLTNARRKEILVLEWLIERVEPWPAHAPAVPKVEWRPNWNGKSAEIVYLCPCGKRVTIGWTMKGADLAGFGLAGLDALFTTTRQRLYAHMTAHLPKQYPFHERVRLAAIAEAGKRKGEPVDVVVLAEQAMRDLGFVRRMHGEDVICVDQHATLRQVYCEHYTGAALLEPGTVHACMEA